MGHFFTTKLNEEQVEDLYKLYQQAWWAGNRKMEDIRTMLGHTDMLFGVCDSNSGKLIGFARVLTDFIYKALLLDVIIDEEYQEKGIGKSLLNHITSHPKLSHVEHLELYCRADKKEYYEKWGFKEIMTELTFMRKTTSVPPLH
ncbi:GNAT family N-acetyltransferase [Falsibacillus pallidus]|uniref:GNAT family N-acetyltransferase n=1 Tax=Falsibacillus pallidus TaxID=493781 RepID=UPI003D99CCE7